MSGVLETADISMAGGGYVRGGFGGGIWDVIALGLVTNGGFLGNRRDDKDCCPPPATCKDVWDVDRDVKDGTNEIGEEICCATNTVKDAVGAVGDKVTGGFYALNDKVSALAYAQQALAKDTQTLIEKGNAELAGLIKTTALEQENKAQAEKICTQSEEINRYKIIAALKGEHKD